MNDVPRICANCAYYVRYQMGGDGHCNAGGYDHGHNKRPGESCSARDLFEVSGSIENSRR